MYSQDSVFWRQFFFNKAIPSFFLFIYFFSDSAGLFLDDFINIPDIKIVKEHSWPATDGAKIINHHLWKYSLLK